MSNLRNFDIPAHKARLARNELRSVSTIGQWNDNIEPSSLRSLTDAIYLPFPPSGNSAVRHANGAHYIRPEVTTYREKVAWTLRSIKPITGRYELHIELSPRDKRERDIDNALKTLFDALVKAGWLHSDSMMFMRRLEVVVRDDFQAFVAIRARVL